MPLIHRLTFLSVLGIFGTLLTSSCGTDYYIISTKPLPPKGPSPDKARIFFMKPGTGGWTGEVAAFILKDIKVIGYLENRQVFYVDLPAGEHIFMSVTPRSNTDGIRANLAGGKTYYIKVYSIPGAASILLGGSENVFMEPMVPGSKDWAKRGEWIGGCELVEINREETTAWEAKFLDNNTQRLANFLSGKATFKLLPPELGE